MMIGRGLNFLSLNSENLLPYGMRTLSPIWGDFGKFGGSFFDDRCWCGITFAARKKKIFVKHFDTILSPPPNWLVHTFGVKRTLLIMTMIIKSRFKIVVQNFLLPRFQVLCCNVHCLIWFSFLLIILCFWELAKFVVAFFSKKENDTNPRRPKILKFDDLFNLLDLAHLTIQGCF